MDTALTSLVQSLPVTGPLIVLFLLAIAYLHRRIERVQDQRVADAQATTAALVAVNTQTNSALAGITTALGALKTSHDQTQDLLGEVKDALPRRAGR